MGAVAFRIHCPKSQRLQETLQREVTDLDLVTYQKYSKVVIKMLEQYGYELDKSTLLYGERRYILRKKVDQIAADVFTDKLEMCHVVDLRGRLELDYPTIPLADLLLEKLQIVRLTGKDVKDVLVLLNEHSIGEGDRESVSSQYISKLLSDDWGFYYTSTENLKKIRRILHELNELSSADKIELDSKLEHLLSSIEKAKKSLRWKTRARIGTSKKWYADVEEIRASQDFT